MSGRQDLNLRLLGPEPSTLPGCVTSRKKNMSGRQDSNLRPPGPKPGALAGLRHFPNFWQKYNIIFKLTNDFF